VPQEPSALGTQVIHAAPVMMGSRHPDGAIETEQPFVPLVLPLGGGRPMMIVGRGATDRRKSGERECEREKRTFHRGSPQ
jgi:hypothetical protein